ncbi:AAA family ATPase [Sinorhizobium medicae]|nr:AAA family ATPase [Sinorhizobium medicae]MDX0997096.1 AAA family ATPase [Sinorhizobium medicae]MDX1059412.1 AAA family ATPase [Sinorhizobium medicae]MDX1182682.1 AAA family ATPase [Sinorhizobium medicae]
MQTRPAVQLNPRAIAAALGGTARGNQISAPAPGHSKRDRSLRVLLDPAAPEGFIVHPLAGEDPIEMRDYVRTRAGLPDWEPARAERPQPTAHLRLVKKAEPPKAFSDWHLTSRGFSHVATYDYTSADGEVLFEVLRYEHPTQPKSFLQRRPDGDGGYFSGREEPVLYRQHELASNTDDPIFVVEGEKDADRLAAFGYLATTVPNGSWPDDLSVLIGREVFVLADNDPAGDKKAKAAIGKMQGLATVARIDLPGLQPKGDVSDWLDAGHTSEELKGLCLASVPVAANDNTPEVVSDDNLLPFVFPSKWQGEAVPPRKWLIDRLVPMRTVTLLSGDGGLGKSLLALQTSVATVLGEKVAGLEPARGKVLYVGAEDEVDEFHRRIDDVLAEHSASYEDLGKDFLLLPLADRDATLAVPEKSGRMTPTPLFERLQEKIADFGPTLIVLDTSADLYGGNEIDRTQVRQFVAMLRSIAIAHDCAIILLSHPSVAGMQSGSGTSGSTAWNNSVRARLYLTAETGDGADPDGRVLTNMKSNYGAKGDAIKLRWDQGVFVLNDGSRPNPAKRIIERKAEDVFLALLSKFNRQGNNVSHVSGTNYAPAKMASHPDSDGVGKKALALAMARLLDAETIKIVEEGPPSKPRKRLIISAEDYGAK